jgi:hypothetical protein
MKLDVANAREVISAFYTVHCAVNSWQLYSVLPHYHYALFGNNEIKSYKIFSPPTDQVNLSESFWIWVTESIHTFIHVL